jgi:general secretion pathway protein B
MSYILDALRKSDQQRQRGATPTLLTAQESAAEPRQSAYLIYGLIAAGLVGAGIVIGWLHPWQSEPPTPAGEAVAAKPLGSGPRQTATAPVAPAPGSVSPGMTGNQARERPAPSLSSAETRGTPPKAVTTSSAEALARVQEITVSAGPTGLSDPTQEQKVMTMGELPPSIRQELPSMQISLHLYSTRPKNSYVSINSRMLQEGEDLAPGIRLEQITPDGMIFSYKGYRFRRGVQ